MADLQRGFTFTDGGGPYNSANLHTLIESGTILPAFVTGKTDTAPVGADSFPYYNSAATALRQCTLTEIIAAFPGDAVAGTKSLRSLGTTGIQAAAGNDVRFPANINAVRRGNGAGNPDTAAVPVDLTFPDLPLAGGNAINWDSADVFSDVMSGSLPRTYTFSNVRNGRIIKVILLTSGYTGTIRWPTTVGTAPTQVFGATVNIFTFWKSQISANPAGYTTPIL